MAQVVRLPIRRSSERCLSPMPDPFTVADLARLLRLSHAMGFRLEHVYYATQIVRGWYLGSPGKRQRADWVMVIRNGMCSGWALEGFEGWYERKGRSVFPKIRGRRDNRGLRVLDPEVVEAVLEVQDARSVRPAPSP